MKMRLIKDALKAIGRGAGLRALSVQRPGPAADRVRRLL